jgi:AraC-like DNA-binding protein
MAWSRVLTFTDPFPYQAALHVRDLEFFPTAQGEFLAELTQVGMNQLWMQRHHQRLPQVNTGTMNAGRRIIGFLPDANSPGLRHCGMDVSTGDIIINNFETVNQRTEANCRYGSMSLTTADFDTACKALTGREFSGAPLKHVVRPSSALMSRLLERHEMVGQLAKTTPDLFVPEVVRSLEQELIHVMVRCLTEGASLEMTAIGRRRGAIVARFEEYLDEHPEQPLYLTEICAAIGASERTLRYCCEEHLGMGPIRYLSLRRMHLARRALLRADPLTTTVTRLATDHGFWELGRFSVTYRELFGEKPSATLQRPSNDRIIFLNRPSSLENSAVHS